MKTSAYLSLTALALASLTAPAGAATIVLNSGTPYSETVHTNSAGSGTSLTTKTKPGMISVLLNSVDGINVGNGDGVASVTGLGSGQGNGFSALLIDPATGFSALQFKAEDFSDQRASALNIKVNFLNAPSQLFTSIGMPSNGKLDVLASGSEVMDSIELYGLINAAGNAVKFKAVKEMSFDAVSGGVPEPAAWAMMLAGFGLAGAAVRRQNPRRTRLA